MTRALVFITLCTVALGACRDAGRMSTTRRTPANVDSGVVFDAGFTDVDAGFGDSGVVVTPDAGFADSGTVSDSGVAADTGVRPDAGPPVGATTVYTLQDPTHRDHPGADARVVLYDVVVTAVGATGNFWVQESAGGPHSGILVFRPMAVPMTGVQVGDRVSLTGTLTEYFDVTEVVLETLDSARPGTPLAPTTLDPSVLANGSPDAEQWEGVFVRVAGVTVLDTNPDEPDDFGEWVVTGGLRIDDQLFALDPRPAVGTSYTAIIGVHHHSFENYKILPRSAVDFVQ